MTRTLALLFTAATLAALPSCASAPEVGFTKVKVYRLDPDKKVDGSDPSINFEQKHYLYGAVTTEERRARKGNYYTFFWRVADTAKPVTVKLEYRQAETGFQVHTLESTASTITSGNNITRFQVTGDTFRKNGRINGWRATLMQNGRAVATRESYLWN